MSSSSPRATSRVTKHVNYSTSGYKRLVTSETCFLSLFSNFYSMGRRPLLEEVRAKYPKLIPAIAEFYPDLNAAPEEESLVKKEGISKENSMFYTLF